MLNHANYTQKETNFPFKKTDTDLGFYCFFCIFTEEDKCILTMEEIAIEYSLIDDLQLQNKYEVVAEKNGKIVYSRTVYYELAEEDYDDFITEDDEPMDNLLSEKALRLLLEAIQNAIGDWTNRSFMACANVAVYYAKYKFIVPDMFLALDVKHPKSWRDKKNKCYYAWLMGKMPDLALEIVSNTVGDEDTKKIELYAELGIKYYIIHDPYFYLSKEELRVYELRENSKYVLLNTKTNYMPVIDLGIILWKGAFENEDSVWARWCNKDGEVYKTGKEQAEEEAKLKIIAEQRAEEERLRAEEERLRAEEEKKRADTAEEEIRKLKAQLEALGLKTEED